jgi:hypothetical protein
MDANETTEMTKHEWRMTKHEWGMTEECRSTNVTEVKKLKELKATTSIPDTF